MLLLCILRYYFFMELVIEQKLDSYSDGTCISKEWFHNDQFLLIIHWI